MRADWKLLRVSTRRACPARPTFPVARPVGCRMLRPRALQRRPPARLASQSSTQTRTEVENNDHPPKAGQYFRPKPYTTY